MIISRMRPNAPWHATIGPSSWTQSTDLEACRAVSLYNVTIKTKELSLAVGRYACPCCHLMCTALATLQYLPLLSPAVHPLSCTGSRPPTHPPTGASLSCTGSLLSCPAPTLANCRLQACLPLLSPDAHCCSRPPTHPLARGIGMEARPLAHALTCTCSRPPTHPPTAHS